MQTLRIIVYRRCYVNAVKYLQTDGDASTGSATGQRLQRLPASEDNLKFVTIDRLSSCIGCPFRTGSQQKNAITNNQIIVHCNGICWRVYAYDWPWLFTRIFVSLRVGDRTVVYRQLHRADNVIKILSSKPAINRCGHINNFLFTCKCLSAK
jgi:hypothetical protein